MLSTILPSTRFVQRWSTLTAATYIHIPSIAALNSFTVASAAVASTNAANSVLSCPFHQTQQMRWYRSPKIKRPRNNQGSNEYRKKKSAERAARLGQFQTPGDVPIQSVTDPSQPWSTEAVPMIRKPVGIDTHFPNFGKKYRPPGYVPPPPTPPKQRSDNDNNQSSQSKRKKRNPLPESEQSDPVDCRGGAFGRADAYRLPNERWGGSYNNPETYMTPKEKAQKKHEEEEEKRLRRQWAKEDGVEEPFDDEEDKPVRPRTAKKVEQQFKPLEQESFEPAHQHFSSSSSAATTSHIHVEPPVLKSVDQPSNDTLPSFINPSEPELPVHLQRFNKKSRADRDFDEFLSSLTGKPVEQVRIELRSKSSTPAVPPKPIETVSATPAIQPPPVRQYDSSRTAPTVTSVQQQFTATSTPSNQPTPQIETQPESQSIPSASSTVSERTTLPPSAPSSLDSFASNEVPSWNNSMDSPLPPNEPSSTFNHRHPSPSERDPVDHLQSGVDYDPYTHSIHERERPRQPRDRRAAARDTSVDTLPLNSPRAPSSLSATSMNLASTSSEFIPPPPPPTATICCGCGAAFQSKFEDSPGYLPVETLANYRKKRMQMFQGRLEAERKKQEAAAAREEMRRARKNGMDDAEENQTNELNPDQPNETSAPPGTIDIQAESSSARPIPSPSNPAPSPNFAPHPDLHRSGKLDPDRPLSEQDLTLALNHGLIDTDDVGGLLAQGIPPELIMTKRELRQLEREEREQHREAHGESAIRCLRCFQLANYGYVRGSVTSVRADDFRLLLRSRFMEKGGRSCVILKVVDLFDFHGSFIKDFASIVGGRNPIILVVNKIDLLPPHIRKNQSETRAWIKAEAERYGLHFHSIELVSALTGEGLFHMSESAKKLAEPDILYNRPRRDIYIVGTTNVGKSSIVNQLMEKKIITSKGQFEATKIRPEELGKEVEKNVLAEVAARSVSSDPSATETPSLYLNASAFIAPSSPETMESPDLLHSTFNVLGGKMTASIVPGTTLGMVSFPFVNKYDPITNRKQGVQHVLYDTPGVINPEQLSNILTFHELRDVMPKRQIQPITFRVTRGQCVILGGLARLDFVAGERDYCFFTIFASRNVTIHITQIEKMDTVETKKKKSMKPAETNVDESRKSDASVIGSDATTSEPTTPAATSPDTPTAAIDESATTSVSETETDSSEPREIGYLEFIKKHGGTRIYPPFTPERCREIGLHLGTRVLFDLHGRGWRESCDDIVFPGLGWISITGSGQLSIRAILPGEVKAYAREPLLPYEAQNSMKKWSGSAIRQH